MTFLSPFPSFTGFDPLDPLELNKINGCSAIFDVLGKASRTDQKYPASPTKIWDANGLTDQTPLGQGGE
jgi:hypothetical protein